MSALIIKGLKDGKTSVTASNGKATSTVEVEIVVASVGVDTSSEPIILGGNPIKAVGRVTTPTEGRVGEFTWSTTTPLIIEVSGVGTTATITPLSVGTGIIKASWVYKGLEFVTTYPIQVVPESEGNLLDALYLNPNPFTAPVGFELSPILTFSPIQADITDMVWEVDDPTILSVERGKFKFLKEGETVVTLKAGGQTTSGKYTCRKVLPKPTKFSWNNGGNLMSIKLATNYSYMLNLQVEPGDAETSIVIGPSRLTRIEIGKPRPSGARTVIISPTGQTGSETIYLSSFADPTQKIALKVEVASAYIVMRGLEDRVELKKDYPVTILTDTGKVVEEINFQYPTGADFTPVDESRGLYNFRAYSRSSNYGIGVEGRDPDTGITLMSTFYVSVRDNVDTGVTVVDDIPFSVALAVGHPHTFTITTKEKDVDFRWTLLAGSGRWDKEDLGNTTGVSTLTYSRPWAGEYTPYLQVEMRSRSKDLPVSSFCKIRVR